jgi:hypothetical protein
MTTTKTTSRQPTHRVYAVTKAEGAGKGFCRDPDLGKILR